MSSARILVGVFGAPHGVRGELRLKPFTADPLALKAYSPLESEDGRQSFKILSARAQGDMLVVKIDGMTDRDRAAALTGTKLFVPRERLPEPDADEYYQTDLIGLRVEDETGAAIGTVIAIEDFGAGDLLEISRPDAPSFHIPFTDPFVPVIDIAGSRIVIAPPEGLMEETTENLDEERG